MNLHRVKPAASTRIIARCYPPPPPARGFRAAPSLRSLRRRPGRGARTPGESLTLLLAGACLLLFLAAPSYAQTAHFGFAFIANENDDESITGTFSAMPVGDLTNNRQQYELQQLLSVRVDGVSYSTSNLSPRASGNRFTWNTQSESVVDTEDAAGWIRFLGSGGSQLDLYVRATSGSGTTRSRFQGTRNGQAFRFRSSLSTNPSATLQVRAAQTLELGEITHHFDDEIRGLVEASLDGATVKLFLTGAEWTDSIPADGITGANLPTGLTFSVARTSDTVATLTLAFDRTDFDEDITDASFTVKAAATDHSADLTTADFTIKTNFGSLLLPGVTISEVTPGDGALIVAWIVDDLRTEPADSYVVVAVEGGVGMEVARCTPTPATGLSCTLTGLTNGTEYSVVLSATVSGRVAHEAGTRMGTPTALRPLDVDGNGTVGLLTDGLLLVRYLIGTRGPALTNLAVAGDPHEDRDTHQEIATYLQGLVERDVLDVDGNGSTGLLTDGLLLVRYLIGTRGPALTNLALAADASEERDSPEEIADYIGGLVSPR